MNCILCARELDVCTASEARSADSADARRNHTRSFGPHRKT
jgi:hypothetical protein